MAGSLNKVMLIGHLGRDPELTHSLAGRAARRGTSSRLISLPLKAVAAECAKHPSPRPCADAPDSVRLLSTTSGHGGSGLTCPSRSRTSS